MLATLQGRVEIVLKVQQTQQKGEKRTKSWTNFHSKTKQNWTIINNWETFGIKHIEKSHSYKMPEIQIQQ